MKRKRIFRIIRSKGTITKMYVLQTCMDPERRGDEKEDLNVFSLWSHDMIRITVRSGDGFYETPNLADVPILRNRWGIFSLCDSGCFPMEDILKCRGILEKIWNRLEMISSDFIPTICIRFKFHSNLIKFLARFPVWIFYSNQLSITDEFWKKWLLSFTFVKIRCV